MADAMPDNTIDDSFEIAQDLLNFSTSDQGEIIYKWIDKYMQILRTVTNRCRKLADLLDATVAQHAEETEKAKQQYEKKLNEMKDEITVHLTSVNDLNVENRTKAANCERLEYALRSIHGRKYHININILKDFFLSHFCFSFICKKKIPKKKF